MEKRVARFHVGEAFGCADAAVAAADDEKFPLREMKVIRADGGAGGDATELQIERMPAAWLPETLATPGAAERVEPLTAEDRASE